MTSLQCRKDNFDLTLLAINLIEICRDIFVVFINLFPREKELVVHIII